MTKKRISIILTSVLLLVALCLSMASCGGNTNNENDSEATEETASLNTEFVNTENVVLMASSVATLSASTNYIEQTITATVLPVTASNKEVDWSIAWADSSNTSNVTDYVTVTPTSDGSTTATVTCKAKFSGNIVITVTTRENGFTASCIVSYVGKATDMTLTTNLTAQSDGYHVNPGSSYTFNVALSNPFGAVSSEYQDITVEIGGVGSVVLGYYEYYVSSGKTIWYDSSDTTVDFNTIAGKLMTASYANGVVTINAVKAIEDYYGSMTRIDSGRTRAYSDAFRSYVTDCYFTVKITETNTGLSKTIKIHYDDTAVASVSLDSEMNF